MPPPTPPPHPRLGNPKRRRFDLLNGGLSRSPSQSLLSHPPQGLESITDGELCCFMISCKNSTNIDSVIDWLVKHSKSKS